MTLVFTFRSLKKFVLLPFFLVYSCFIFAQNAIVTENLLPGNPQSEWDVSGAGDLTIQGFATDISVNKGSTIHFKINTDASAYTIDIYRLGYYQGNGARKVGVGTITAALPQSQPADLYDASTGLTDCGNWAESAHWDVPSTAVSGIYIAKLTRTDNSGSSHIVFIVRDDASTSDLFFKTSDATWEAYNVYGGNSLYVGSTSYASGHAAKVSYNRPFITRDGGGGGGAAEDWLFNAEYPMIRWLEKNGYNISYTTDVDVDRNGSFILNHKVFLSVGHDEYWSAQARSNVEAARNAGIHLAFFSGNEIYWKTRYENSTDGSSTPYRTLVCYKEGTLGENVCGGKCDPLPNTWTGLWRDGCSFPTNDGCNPENALSGQISWDGTTGAIEVPDTYKNLRFWRNTSVASLTAGQTKTFSDGTLGYEWDWDQYQTSFPTGRFTLSSTLLNTHKHQLSIYKAASGALVFGAGTVQWSWGLDGNHDRGGSVEDADMQQATVNLFADMGVQPGSLQTGLIPATASTDTQAPVSIITSPANGVLLPNGSTVTISGTASDNAVVAGVEVSTDGGAHWTAATGTTSWTFSWIPDVAGVVIIKSRAIDDSGILEAEGSAPSADVVIDTVSAPLPVVCPCTAFQPTDVPSTPLTNDGQAIELGVKFQVTENGYITGIRYYKGAGATGLHRGHIWSSTTLLAEAIFTSETASGWQQVNFPTPIPVVTGTTYLASYHSNSGDYAFTDYYYTTAKVNGPIRFLADGEDGANGVYRYSSEPSYPGDNYHSSNYWVDVVFNTTVAPDTIPPTITATSPAANATGVNINSPVSATFSEAIDVSTLNTSSFLLLDASSTSVPATVSYNAATRTAILSPISPLAYLTTYTVTVKGGTGYQRIKDVEGNALANDSSWTFTTSPVPPPPPPAPTEGPGGPILVISGATNPFSRYPVEILRAEGLNEFTAMDISLVNATILNNYEVIVLGEFPLTAADVTMFTNWVNAGGTLIALRPDAQLAPLLGITSAGSSMSDKYLLVNNTGAGIGIVNQTIQYHGAADLYNLSGASSLATLYSSASAATVYPAVTIHNVGTNGGQAVAFTYDLARSIVYTRQGNPLWAGQKRDGQIDPIRSDDQFFPDYVDLSKVAIPQADEQQHLLSNIIIKSNLHHKPLPKFWFLPKGVKAAVVMTGDNHGDAGMQPRFDINITESPAGCSVDDWDCIRSTGYLYVGSTFTDSMALYYSNLGFEVALHVNTNCNNFTRSEYENYVTSQLTDFSNTFPSISRPSTNRNHCIAWSDWSTTPEVEVEQGIRLDANYYYWPGSWVNNQPGMFTGSGMPMRFAKMDGTIIDCYQAVTQMPDESDESFPSFCDALLDKAQGPEGYYGVFTTNMHFDNTNHAGANAIVASALAHHIPVVSAKQMLTWLDGRNNSSFGSLSWNADTLKFNVTAATGSRNMQAMVPTNAATGHLTAIYVNSSLATYTVQTIKGIEYAFISAPAGNYAAIYGDTTLLHITALAATPVSTTSANITWNTDHAADSHVKYGLSPTVLNQSASAAALVNSHTILLSGLSPATTYYYRVTSTDAASDSATAPVLALPPQNFVTPGTPCAIDEVAADFNSGTPDANITVSDETDGEVILKALFSDDFTGTSLSSNWTSGTWTSGGTATLSTGSLNVDGSFAATNSTFAPGSSMEFVATFQSATFQNIGFATDAAFSAPWITIGQGSSAGTLYARSDAGTSVALGAGLVGTPHLYRINWNPSSFDFYVDGVLSATITQTITGNMVAIASDYNSGGGILQADWIHVTPYALAGSFTSRIFDHSDTTTWNTITWNGITPSGTTLNMFVRTGNTAIPDGTWAAFSSVANGASIGVASRYIQYRADLSTINSANTPVLQDISIGCGTAVICVPPTASISAVNPQVCLGGNISLQLDSASGQPPYTLTVNGTSYTNVLPGQTFAVIPPTEHSIWGSSGSPANANASDALPIETGTKFRASVNGYVTGIRFYKGVTNTGIHTASLWNTNGKQLATAPFTAETASGWQEVHFATPVYIKADTTYIASYFSPGGTFAITPSFFAGTGVSNPPLSALQAGTDGVNGVYKYGGGFPDGGNTANYWVDVLFMQEQTSAQIINYTLTNITDNLTCSNA
ncbi:MAG: N,N-dimethylformamidase beta subunit family domain-containing protein, partial [Bacteroidia bacterium]